MEYLLNILKDILTLVNEMSPYLLLGFLLAGLMHEFIPGAVYTKYLSGRNFRSVLLSALFGVPLPLCSCGVIPTAMGIRREGASKGATISFLIATPQTGVDSIIATYSLMGLPFAIVRPIAAFVTAIFGGVLCNVFDSDDEIIIVKKTKDEGRETKDDDEREPLSHRLREVMEYAFVEMMEDIGKWLLVGLVLAGLITALVPDAWFMVFKGNTLYSVLFVLVFSIPMYLCATGSIPVAVALMMKGLTPGAALVLLMAGPASNAASMLVINKVLGRRTLVIYLLSITIGAIVFAFGIDALPGEWFAPSMMVQGDCCSESLGIFSTVCSVVLALLLLNALTPLRFWKPRHAHCHCHGDHCSCEEEKEEHCGAARTYRVQGMHCNHCAANTRKAILSVEGVEEAEVSLEDGTATIRGHYDEQAVRQAVEQLGFEFGEAPEQL